MPALSELLPWMLRTRVLVGALFALLAAGLPVASTSRALLLHASTWVCVCVMSLAYAPEHLRASGMLDWVAADFENAIPLSTK